MQQSLEDKIKRMAEHVDEEAIARALGIEIELVRDILSGNATKLESSNTQGALQRAPQTKYIKTTYRQRVISVARFKGGVGASTLAANMARYLSEHNSVLLLDLCASLVDSEDLGIRRTKVCSDLLDIFEAQLYRSERGTDALELDLKLHYLPVLGDSDIKELVLEAREQYDIIIIDLPDLSRYGTDALEVSTSIVALFSGRHAEAERMLMLNRLDKEKLLAAHTELTPDGKRVIEDNFEADNYIQLQNLNGIVSRKVPAYRGIEELCSMMYSNRFNEKKRGLLGALFNRA